VNLREGLIAELRLGGPLGNSPLRAGRRRSAFARKLEHLLNTYRHPDGREWTGAEIEKATVGVVQRSYTTNPARAA
jgi:hypothetical protein